MIFTYTVCLGFFFGGGAYIPYGEFLKRRRILRFAVKSAMITVCSLSFRFKDKKQYIKQGLLSEKRCRRL